jgi:hypothetical protein
LTAPCEELLRESGVSLASRDVTTSAKLFAQALELPYAPADSLSSSVGNGANTAVLLPLLNAPREQEPDWLCRVAEGWLEVGEAALACEVVARARRIIESGVRPPWAALVSLAELDLRTRQRSGRTVPAREWQRRLPGFEARSQKVERLQLLFGRGERDVVRQRAQRAANASDTVGLILCFTAGGGHFSTRDYYALVTAWHDANEHRAAVDEFLALVADRRLDRWFDEARRALLDCGRALQYLGDLRTAYAAFRLAAGWRSDDPETPPDLPRDETSANTTEVAREHSDRLAWARTSLDTDEGILPRSVTGPPAGAWLARQGLAGRYRAYLERLPDLKLLYPPAVLARQFGTMGTHEDGSPRSFAPAGPDPPAHRGALPAPPALPLTGRAPPLSPWRGAEPRGVRDRREDISGTRVRAPLGFVDPNSKRLIGFLEVMPEAPALVLGAVATDDLFLSVAEHLRREGWVVLWLRRGAGSPPVLSSQGPPWLTIGPGALSVASGASTPPPASQWLQDIAQAPDFRRSVVGCLAGILPPCADPAASACLEALVDEVSQDESGRERALGRGKPEDDFRYALELLGEHARLRFHRLRDLRRAVSLLDYLTAALETLRAALCTDWFEAPADPQAGATPPGGGACVDLPTDDPARAALMALLCAGSLLHSCERQSSGGAELDALLEQFQLRPKARGEGKPEAETPPAEPRDRDPETIPAPGEKRDESQWVRHGVLPSTTAPRVCILITGGWSPEWPLLLDWFRPGGLGQHQSLVAGSQTAPPDLAKRSVLKVFRTFLLGALPSEAVELLQLATGVSLRDAMAAAALGTRGAVCVRLKANDVRLRRLVVWPAAGSGV